MKYFDQEEWNKLGNGIVSIIFYANDTPGNIAYEEIIMRKDAYKTIIFIHNPLDNEKFGKYSHNFNISFIEDPSVITWYTIVNRS